MAEQETPFEVPFEVAEACLAHKIGNATSQRYNHATLLKLRRPVMERWAKFLSGGEADSNVVPMKRVTA